MILWNDFAVFVCEAASLNKSLYVIFHEEDEQEDVSSSSVLLVLFSELGRGAQIRTVASSLADANIDG